MDKKKALRKRMLAVRKDIPNKQRKSQLIVDIIKNNHIFQKSKIIGLYNPLLNEVDISDLISYALSCGKRVLLPRVVNSELVFLQINESTIYEKSVFQVLEPIYNKDFIYNGVIDLIIVPGLAFSKNGERLGYGKGFYDRFLVNKTVYKIGVCFSEQYLDNIYVNQNDISMDLVISA